MSFKRVNNSSVTLLVAASSIPPIRHIGGPLPWSQSWGERSPGQRIMPSAARLLFVASVFEPAPLLGGTDPCSPKDTPDSSLHSSQSILVLLKPPSQTAIVEAFALAGGCIYEIRLDGTVFELASPWSPAVPVNHSLASGSTRGGL